jgi:hypothetical protein
MATLHFRRLNLDMVGTGQGGSMGFEETEEIGPDGKPHIISEKSFNPSGPGPKLTKAQIKQQKAMEKEMAVMSHTSSTSFLSVHSARCSLLPVLSGCVYYSHLLLLCVSRSITST